MPVAMLLGSFSHGHMKAERRRAATASARSTGGAGQRAGVAGPVGRRGWQHGADPGVSAFERMGAGGLDGVQPGFARDRPELGGLAQALGARAGQGTTADLDDDVVEAPACQV